jgi:ribosome-binding protein aMBF1 (putative translation factor)
VQRRRYVRATDVPAVRAILEKRREERHSERLANTQSLRSWRQLLQLVEDYEARIHEERERL